MVKRLGCHSCDLKNDSLSCITHNIVVIVHALSRQVHTDTQYYHF